MNSRVPRDSRDVSKVANALAQGFFDALLLPEHIFGDVKDTQDGFAH